MVGSTNNQQPISHCRARWNISLGLVHSHNTLRHIIDVCIPSIPYPRSCLPRCIPLNILRVLPSCLSPTVQWRISSLIYPGFPNSGSRSVTLVNFVTASTSLCTRRKLSRTVLISRDQKASVVYRWELTCPYLWLDRWGSLPQQFLKWHRSHSKEVTIIDVCIPSIPYPRSCLPRCIPLNILRVLPSCLSPTVQWRISSLIYPGFPNSGSRSVTLVNFVTASTSLCTRRKLSRTVLISRDQKASVVYRWELTCPYLWLDRWGSLPQQFLKWHRSHSKEVTRWSPFGRFDIFRPPPTPLPSPPIRRFDPCPPPVDGGGSSGISRLTWPPPRPPARGVRTAPT